MIQRIQTLYLLIISLCSILGWFLLPPLDFSILDFSLLIVSKAYLITTGGIALSTLMLFKHRKLQLLFNNLHFFVQIITLVGFVYGLMNSSKMNILLPWFALPVLVLILLILIIRAIKKDEDLIRSIDRLR